VVLESLVFSKYSASWPQQQVMIVVLGLANSLLLRFAFVAVPDYSGEGTRRAVLKSCVSGDVQVPEAPNIPIATDLWISSRIS